jgi:dTDP-4-amino-4,6-dideoxygalactose transaminase
VQAFEQRFRDVTHASHAIATTSCTTALHLALAVLGVGAGDEVIVPSFTYVASANVVEQTGARTVFVDADPETFNIDPVALGSAVTPRTTAIMPVHLFGLCADMDAVMATAARHKLHVIEDAACAVGSHLNGRHAGTSGDFGCFSFHARKVITTGEGGMLTTNDDALARRASVLRSHGGEVSDLERHRKGAFALPEHEEVGFNYRMTDFQGALGLVQMDRLEAILDRRQELAAEYTRSLEGVPGVHPPQVPPNANHTFQSYVLRIGPEAALPRDELAASLQQRGIATRQGTHAVHLLAYYRKKYDLAPEDFPQSLSADRDSLSLPIFPSMSAEEQAYVVANIRELLG